MEQSLTLRSIMGPLMENRTCILVTHNTALCVPRASHVVVMDNGQIKVQGKPTEVIASGALGDSDILKIAVSGPASRLHSSMPSRVPSFSTLSDAVPKQNGNGTVQTGVDAKVKEATRKQDTDESKTEGSVDWKVYFLYLHSMGAWWFWMTVFFSFTLQQLGSMAGSIWIREW